MSNLHEISEINTKRGKFLMPLVLWNIGIMEGLKDKKMETFPP
jgi:hypothetical protein